MDLLLGYSKNENISGWRDSVICELRQYLLNYICGNFTFETLNLHARESTLEKIVPQGLIRNTDGWMDGWMD